MDIVVRFHAMASVVAALCLLFCSTVIGQDTEEPYTEADRDKPKTFWNTRLEITPCCNVSLKEAEITLWFRTDGNFSGSDALFFELPRKSKPNELESVLYSEVPDAHVAAVWNTTVAKTCNRRFTTGSLANGFQDAVDIPLGELHVSPSTLWDGAWKQGVYDEHSPYEDSRLTVVMKSGRNLAPADDEDVFVRISKRNGIAAFCGWAENDEGFRMTTNSSTHDFEDESIFEIAPLFGSGCRADCYERGVCDYCQQSCLCNEGQGDKTADVVDSGGWVRLDCADYVCPAGKSWTGRQKNLEGGGWGAFKDHAMAECSGNGSCNRTDASCICEPGFEGDACQRNTCPGLCSDHGMCLSMHDLAQTAEALPLMSESTIYGGVGSNETVAWDAEAMYACVCDSSWEVGLGAGQRQQAEYFGADCSQRRCPTGDDPITSADETNCEGVVAAGGFGTGEAGNVCHVDCSNRGQCDHKTGDCDCYAGFYGDSCGKTTALT